MHFDPFRSICNANIINESVVTGEECFFSKWTATSNLSLPIYKERISTVLYYSFWSIVMWAHITMPAWQLLGFLKIMNLPRSSLYVFEFATNPYPLLAFLFEKRKCVLLGVACVRCIIDRIYSGMRFEQTATRVRKRCRRANTAGHAHRRIRSFHRISCSRSLCASMWPPSSGAPPHASCPGVRSSAPASSDAPPRAWHRRALQFLGILGQTTSVVHPETLIST